MRTLLVRNTEASVIGEVTLAKENAITVHVPVHPLFFTLDEMETKMGITDGLQKYVTHTKEVAYDAPRHGKIKVRSDKHVVAASPQAAVDNLEPTAQKIRDLNLHDMHGAVGWTPATQSYSGVNNSIVLAMSTHIKKFDALPKDTRHGPFPLYAAKYVQTILAQDKSNKVLMATKHRVLIHALQNEFKALGLRLSVLGAGTLVAAKKNLNMFNEEEVRIMILMQTNASAGLNLQTSSHLILLDDPASITDADRKQLVGRIQRIDQKRAEVQVVHLVPERQNTDVTAPVSNPSRIDLVSDDDDSMPPLKRARHE